MQLEELELKNKYRFPQLFKTLWEKEMLDWMGGRTTPFSSDENWEKTIYPTIKEHPPVLLHTGGFDFEMLTKDEMLSFQFDEFWDLDKHTFIPFAKSEEGAVYAFYKNIETDGESAIVCIWNDMNETEVLAKNFEDFIFRRMIEAVYDVDKDDLKGDYQKDGFEGYRKDILNDLKSISPYLKKEYIEILEEVYNRATVMDGVISYGLLDNVELGQIIQEHLSFKALDAIFEHELG